MFKAFSPAVLKDMAEQGNIIVTIKAGWEMGGNWTAKPSHIYYCMATEREKIFTCYFHRDPDSIQMTNIEATKLISDNKALIDAYMYVALAGLIDFSKSLGVSRLIVDSYISSAADHMLDLGFTVTSKGLQSGSRGCKLIKD